MRLLPTSLTARLIAAVVGLVALVCLLIASLTTIAVGGFLRGQLDDKVGDTHERALSAYRDGRSEPFPDHGPPPGGRPDIRDPRGQDVGTLTAYLGEDSAGGNVIDNDGDLVELDGSVLAELASVNPDRQTRTVELRGLGHYRVLASSVGDTTVMTGYPTYDMDDTLSSLVGWEALFSALGVLTAGGIALLVVRRQLRPLREVAATAHEVAGLPLASGEVGHTARVPERLTDEHTEVGQVGLALNTLLGHMEQSLDARHRSELQVRQFVADASHELRTPLTTIQGYAELALRQDEADELRHAMGKVKSESDRMRSLVEDLLLLARLDAGRPLERADVDLTRLALETVQDARVVSPDHRWALDLEAEAVVVPGDELRLHQVLTNLLTNARRHTPPGTTVTVSVRGGGDAVVTVADDGPGIPPDLQARIFERFTRGDSARTRSSGGAGLGLSLAEAITAAHGGTLAASSRPGDTRFTLMLPR